MNKVISSNNGISIYFLGFRSENVDVILEFWHKISEVGIIDENRHFGGKIILNHVLRMHNIYLGNTNIMSILLK